MKRFPLIVVSDECTLSFLTFIAFAEKDFRHQSTYILATTERLFYADTKYAQ